MYAQRHLKVLVIDFVELLCKEWHDGKVIDAAGGSEHQGMWLDSTLNMNEHLQRILGKVNSRIQLLPHVRHSLSVLPPEWYTPHLFC